MLKHGMLNSKFVLPAPRCLEEPGLLFALTLPWSTGAPAHQSGHRIHQIRSTDSEAPPFNLSRPKR